MTTESRRPPTVGPYRSRGGPRKKSVPGSRTSVRMPLGRFVVLAGERPRLFEHPLQGDNGDSESTTYANCWEIASGCRGVASRAVQTEIFPTCLWHAQSFLLCRAVHFDALSQFCIALAPQNVGAKSNLPLTCGRVTIKITCYV
jgi:hypothetical protein